MAKTKVQKEKIIFDLDQKISDMKSAVLID